MIVVSWLSLTIQYCGMSSKLPIWTIIFLFLSSIILLSYDLASLQQRWAWHHGKGTSLHQLKIQIVPFLLVTCHHRHHPWLYRTECSSLPLKLLPSSDHPLLWMWNWGSGCGTGERNSPASLLQLFPWFFGVFHSKTSQTLSGIPASSLFPLVLFHIHLRWGFTATTSLKLLISNSSQTAAAIGGRFSDLMLLDFQRLP